MLAPGRARVPPALDPRGRAARAVHQDIERILFDERRIHEGIERVAGEVTRAYRGVPFTVVSVLKGSCVFVSDLIRRVPIPLELAFAAVSSYGARTEPGRLEVQLLPGEGEIAGRSLLLVDDILDTGRTLRFLRDELAARGARDVKACVFLDKPSRREVPFEADFRAFEVEDLFVVGYGLDFAGHYRNLPYVGALRSERLARPSATPSTSSGARRDEGSA